MNRFESSENRISEEEVIKSLNTDTEEVYLGLLGRYIDQCQTDADLEYTLGEQTGLESHLVNVRVSIKVASVYLGSDNLWKAGIYVLEEAREALQHGGESGKSKELLREVDEMILRANTDHAGIKN